MFHYGEDVPTGNRQRSRSRGSLLQGRKDLLRNPPESSGNSEDSEGMEGEGGSESREGKEREILMR